MTRISIVTVARNCLPDLRRTIDSVRGQTYPGIEFIVVDGASTDGTAGFLQSHGADFRWVSEPDGGIADAFNKGMRMASADTLLFLNAGDTLADPQTVEEIFRCLPADVDVAGSIIYGNFFSVSPAETRLVHADHRQLDRSNTINHQSALIGRALYRRFAYDERLFLGMDYDYWLRCRAAGVPFIKVEVPVARYGLTGRSSSLDYRLHNELMRYFLRVLNGGKVLQLGDFFEIVRIGARTSWQVFIRRVIPGKLWRWLKVRSGRSAANGFQPFGPR